MDFVGVETQDQPTSQPASYAAAEVRRHRPCLYCGARARPGSFWCCRECEADWERAITPSWAR